MKSVWWTLCLWGCIDARADRCDTLRAELERCTGAPLRRLDCSLVSDVDLDRVEDLTRGLSCALIAGALPIDGDLQSITCRTFSVGCVAPKPSAAPVKAPRLPVVLVNGFDNTPLFRYSPRIVEALRSAGANVALATLPSYSTTHTRVPALWKHVDEARRTFGAERVHLVCHSLGGLDCRYLVSPGGYVRDEPGTDYAAAIASVTTVGTAHHGTKVVDVLLGLVPDERRGELLDDFAAWLGDAFSAEALAEDAELRASLAQLTTSATAAFNAEIADAPGVLYQSYGGRSAPFGEAPSGVCGDAATDYLALPLVPLARLLDGPSDGLIPLASAAWGNFAGCVPADHMEQLGQYNLPDVNVRNGFDVAQFYVEVASGLAARGL